MATFGNLMRMGGGMFGGSRFRMYAKGKDLLFIQVSGGAHERNSTLAVMQKKLN